MNAVRSYETGPGFVRAKECPDCGHTKCGESCVCNCDAARAEDEAFRLRARVIVLEAALRLAHACASLRDDGTCDGCFVSEALGTKETK